MPSQKLRPVQKSAPGLYFEQMVGQLYPTEFQLNKATSSDTEAPFLNLYIANSTVSSKIYDKWD